MLPLWGKQRPRHRQLLLTFGRPQFVSGGKASYQWQACFSAALGLKGFRLPKGLIGGEITGLSWVSSSVSGAFWSLLVIQVPFLVLGYSSLGQKFALRTLETLWALAGGISSFPYPLHDGKLFPLMGPAAAAGLPPCCPSSERRRHWHHRP
ncbi:YitT family protein [Hymenobacter volaticus]|uniref:YitT family protein n=1 Tax=Hymenobacter volaticus TaxID=2932254 RepID=UPI0035CAF285